MPQRATAKDAGTPPPSTPAAATRLTPPVRWASPARSVPPPAVAIQQLRSAVPIPPVRMPGAAPSPAPGHATPPGRMAGTNPPVQAKMSGAATPPRAAVPVPPVRMSGAPDAVQRQHPSVGAVRPGTSTHQRHPFSPRIVPHIATPGGLPIQRSHRGRGGQRQLDKDFVVDDDPRFRGYVAKSENPRGGMGPSMTQVRLKRQTSAGGRFWVEGAPVDPNATRQSVGLKHTVTKTAYDREHKLDYVILQKVMDEMVAAFEVRADDASDLLRWAENDSKNVVMITHKTHKTFVTIRSTTKITDSQRRRAKNIIKRAKINRTLYGGSITAMHNAEILRIGDPAHTEWDDIKKEWVDV